ncbi:MAG TPA: sugar ABC transporter ATP-binding protein [Candidatus Limnocylindria bacterium]|nr:sugar ABC transporter ATP-binding protein [Candidatus Limnocylindria bacterium]
MRGITKVFPGVTALKDVTLTIRRGEVHALVGENGAGKSTLMKILSGVHKPTSGEILLDGQAVSLSNVRDAQEKGISIIFQEFNLVNTLSIAENIYLGRYPGRGGVDWKRMRGKAEGLLRQLGFDIDVNRVVGTLSTAEKQLVEIAKALSFEAKIIVMDEPTSSLTKRETELLFPIIDRLRSGGITVIYITHKLEEIYRLCDRVTVLRDGEVAGVHPLSEVSQAQIIEKMVGRAVDMEFPARASAIGEVVLSVRGLGRAGKLSDISFDLHRGEILGFAGLVGAGRTELAEALFGASPKTSGEMRIGGTPVHIGSTAAGLARSIGMLTEDRKETGLILGMDIPRNVTVTKLRAVSGRLFLSARRENAAAQEYVGKLNIKTPSLRQTTVNLSGGNQQKVVMAKWLFSDAQILILDEPTRGIDVGAKYEIYLLMNRLASEGKSIIMISSELPEVIGMSDRVLVMHEGKVKGELTGERKTAANVMELAIS